MSKKQKTEYVAVGGQALMEGIMMRGPKGTAMSLRLPDGSIETQMKDFVSLRRKHKILNIPIIRGVIAFVESMVFGYKLLMESAEKTSLDTEEEAESKFDKWISDHFGPKMMTVIGVISSGGGSASPHGYSQRSAPCRARSKRLSYARRRDTYRCGGSLSSSR